MGLNLPAFLLDVARLAIWLVILVAIFLPLERLFAVHKQPVLRRGLGQDVVYYFLNNLLPAVLLSVPVAMLAWLGRHLTPQALVDAVAALPLWAQLLLGLVASEFGYYWGHRWCHELPLLWRFHSLHHGAREMDFLVNTHAHPLDMVFGRFCGLVPLHMLGLASPANLQGSVLPVAVFLGGLGRSRIGRAGRLGRLLGSPEVISALAASRESFSVSVMHSDRGIMISAIAGSPCL